MEEDHKNSTFNYLDKMVVQEIQVKKNASTHAETATDMIVLVETAGTIIRNAQMFVLVLIYILWSQNPLPIYLIPACTCNASFCLHEGWV